MKDSNKKLDTTMVLKQSCNLGGKRRGLLHQQQSTTGTLRTTASSLSRDSFNESEHHYVSFQTTKANNVYKNRDDEDNHKCLAIGDAMKRAFMFLFFKPCSTSTRGCTAIDDCFSRTKSSHSFEWFDASSEYDNDEEHKQQECSRPDLNASTLWKEKRLGGGMYGQVHLVRQVKQEEVDETEQQEGDPDITTFALKIQNYSSAKRQREIDEEIDIMKRFSNRDSSNSNGSYPFLCQLHNVYDVKPNVGDLIVLNGKNKSNFTLKCMVMDAYEGGELYHKIHPSSVKTASSSSGGNGNNESERGLSEPLARFYAANVWMALKSLHSLGIAYRDMKPENILLDHQGYCHLIDFGFAKNVYGDDVRDRRRTGGNKMKRVRCKTICGTPLYFAPEVLKGRGYDGIEADVWSYGILVYEMLTGHTPFCSEGNLNQMTRPALYRRIMRGKYKFPSFSEKEVSDDAKHFVSRLLQLIPHERIGCNAYHNAVEDHAWFVDPSFNMEPLDFEQLCQKNLPVPV